MPEPVPLTCAACRCAFEVPADGRPIPNPPFCSLACASYGETDGPAEATEARAERMGYGDAE